MNCTTLSENWQHIFQKAMVFTRKTDFSTSFPTPCHYSNLWTIHSVPVMICITLGGIYLAIFKPKMFCWCILFGQPYSSYSAFNFDWSHFSWQLAVVTWGKLNVPTLGNSYLKRIVNGIFLVWNIPIFYFHPCHYVLLVTTTREPLAPPRKCLFKIDCSITQKRLPKQDMWIECFRVRIAQIDLLWSYVYHNWDACISNELWKMILLCKWCEEWFSLPYRKRQSCEGMHMNVCV